MASNDYFVIKEEHRKGPWKRLCTLNNHINSTKEQSSSKRKKSIYNNAIPIEEKDRLKKNNPYEFRLFEKQLFYEDSFLVTCKYCKNNVHIDSITSHTGCQASTSVPVVTHNSNLVDSPLLKSKKECVEVNCINKEKKANSGCLASSSVPVVTHNSIPVDSPSPLIKNKEEYVAVNCINKEKNTNSDTKKSHQFNHVKKINCTEVKQNQELLVKGKKRKENVLKPDDADAVFKKIFLGNNGSSAANETVEDSVPKKSYLYLSQRLFCAGPKISANRLRHSSCGLVVLNGRMLPSSIRESMVKAFSEKRTINMPSQCKKEAPPVQEPWTVRNSIVHSHREDSLKSTSAQVKRPPKNGTLYPKSPLINKCLVNGIDGNDLNHPKGHSPFVNLLAELAHFGICAVEGPFGNGWFEMSSCKYPRTRIFLLTETKVGEQLFT